LEKEVPHRAGDPFEVHLHKRQAQRLLVALVAGEEPRGEGPFPVLGNEQVQRAHPGAQSPRLVAVASPGASLDALVRGGAHVLGHLRFEHLLEHPLHDLAQEAGIVQQGPLHRLRVQPTMILGHRHSVSDRLTLDTNHLGGRWPLFSSRPPIYRTLRTQPLLSINPRTEIKLIRKTQPVGKAPEKEEAS
jgi:hypothetical protein